MFSQITLFIKAIRIILVDGACTTVFKDRKENTWLGVLGLGLAKLDTALHIYPMPNVLDEELTAKSSQYSIKLLQDVRTRHHPLVHLWLGLGKI